MERASGNGSREGLRENREKLTPRILWLGTIERDRQEENR